MNLEALTPAIVAVVSFLLGALWTKWNLGAVVQAGEQLGATVKEIADVVTVASAAAADRTITSQEADQIRQEVSEARQAIHLLLTDLRQMAAKQADQG